MSRSRQYRNSRWVLDAQVPRASPDEQELHEQYYGHGKLTHTSGFQDLISDILKVTFDENHSYAQQNRVVAILLGDAIPTNLVGTTDSAYYNHYSEIATVQANWGLDTLGRWDVGANVFQWVAAKTGDSVRAWSGKVPLSKTFFNASYAGKLNDKNTSVPWPVPNTKVQYAGRTVLPAISSVWGKQVDQSAYTSQLEIPDGMHPEAEFK
jgi:acid phosphatase